MAVLFALGLLSIPAVGRAADDEKTAVEEILDILKIRGIISEEEHQDLLERARAEAQQAPNTFDVYWKDGIRMKTKDDAFQMRIGGRIQADWAYFDADEDVENFFGDNEDFGHGTEFRRTRIFLQGLLYDRFEFKSQFDFTGGDVDFNDVCIGLKKIPYMGNLRVGHMKEPFSLQNMTSSKYITFMERGLPHVFAPGRNMGITLFNNTLDDRFGWYMGGYREVDNFGFGFGDENEYNLTARVRGLPWYADEGNEFFHLGLSYTHKFRNAEDGTTLRFRERPEAHLSPFRYIDTGNFLVDGLDTITPEVALVCGPLSLQGEYYHPFTDTPIDNPDFWGYYVEASYFLTGEHRPSRGGAFKRIRPQRNFLAEGGGWGAWQVALRYSSLDPDDETLGSVDGLGGRLDNFTAGLNWYLNPNLRWIFNYVFADLDEVGDTHILETRFQVEF